MVKSYLIFDKNCAEALDLYVKAFKGEIPYILKYGDMPPAPNFEVTPEMKNLVLHAELTFFNSGVQCCDVVDGLKGGSDNIFVSVMPDTVEEAKFAWEVLKEGATILMDMEETFFAECHGTLRDRFGINWMITIDKPM